MKFTDLYQRCANIRNQFKLPAHLKLANFTNYSDPNFDPRLRDPTLTWEGISWLKTRTNLPIIVKGILHPEDAILAVKQGVKGTLVIFKYLKPCTVVYRFISKNWNDI